MSGSNSRLTRRNMLKASVVAAAAPGIIQGYVREQGSGTPIVHVDVSVEGGGRALTNESGFYRITDVPHLFDCDDRLVFEHRPVKRLDPLVVQNVGACEHRNDAGDSFRPRSVDALDARVRIRAP